jgi:hypothetical protein
MVVMYETSIAMASAGASFEQIVAANAIGMFSGAIGNGIGGLVGSGAAGALIGGAISGGINGAMTTAYGRWRYGSGGDLGTNVLEGAARGAVMAGISAAVGYQFAASQASAEAAEGEGATKETTGEDARKRAADIKLAKDRAVFDGRILRDKISGVPVTIYGETADERQAAFDALKTDLTADCDESRSILKALGNRRDSAGVRPLEVVLVHSAGDIGSFSVPGSNEIVVDRWNVDDVYDSKVPGGRFTYGRVLAHELGHAAL